MLRGSPFLLAAALVLAAPAEAFRCGDSLVTVGDTKAKVLLECGAPTLKEKVGAREETYGAKTRGKRAKKTKTVEQWTYNCGEGDFIYILTFEGGKLTKEETGGRGRGRSECRGR
ncbi:MAG TPA: DUF2845 domain-containing protein [Syntrophales bacterium]|nr:DUF2845 domain-containing protein [Syntrophales bacterium]HOM07111.1 DUF2845 domain-containing protein [Syntrophales bacterium]HOO00374.1 DUF2845 domain-containing protein [Syntrophales bacterium]HPC00445.1 DUF2845 domain-containing protein [Syntrophales bacterium]HPQ05528.1 DUF2845 domain-containing protein [Syntrophales bacterium]